MQDKMGSGERDDVEELVSGLLAASRVLVGVAARSLSEVADVVTLTQYRTLVVLSGHGELRLNQLAELLTVNASTAQRMVERLTGSGLVARRTNPESRREVLLTLTAEGARIVAVVAERRRREIATVVRRMPAGEREGAVAALRAFAVAADEPEVPRDGSLWGWSLLPDPPS